MLSAPAAIPATSDMTFAPALDSAVTCQAQRRPGQDRPTGPDSDQFVHHLNGLDPSHGFGRLRAAANR